MNIQKRKAILLGVLGLVLILAGIKSMPFFLSMASQQTDYIDKPVILFFNIDHPCECMAELTLRAEQQMASWPVERQGGIPVERIKYDRRKDLQAKYKVFRAPCLVLVNDRGEVAWRQDYPLIEGGPFELEELEENIATLGIK